MHTYYVVKTGENRYDLRQTRYQEMFMNGKEHKNDVMATGFTLEGMQEIINKWFADTNTTNLV